MLDVEKILQFQKEIERSEELVIVEGKRDKHQLSLLGWKNVIDISGKSLPATLEAVEKYDCKSVVILTDFDDEGVEKHKTLAKFFSANGISVNNLLRNQFKSIFKTNTVEEIAAMTKLIPLSRKVFNQHKFFNKHMSKRSKWTIH